MGSARGIRGHEYAEHDYDDDNADDDDDDDVKGDDDDDDDDDTYGDDDDNDGDDVSVVGECGSGGGRVWAVREHLGADTI